VGFGIASSSTRSQNEGAAAGERNRVVIGFEEPDWPMMSSFSGWSLLLR